MHAFPGGMKLSSDSHSAGDEMEAEMSALTGPKSCGLRQLLSTWNLLQGNKWKPSGYGAI